MELEITDFLRRPRDSKREKELLQHLRRLPEETRYDIVRQLLQQDKGMGLLMASGSLWQKRYFEEILELGFQEGNASTILPWLECAVPKLGFRKVLLTLNNRINTDPVSVDNALYWMPRFKPQNDPRADVELREIRIRQAALKHKSNKLTKPSRGVGMTEALRDFGSSKMPPKKEREEPYLHVHKPKLRLKPRIKSKWVLKYFQKNDVTTEKK